MRYRYSIDLIFFFFFSFFTHFIDMNINIDNAEYSTIRPFIQPTLQPRDDIEQLPKNQRGWHLERLFEYEYRNSILFILNFMFKRRSASFKPININSGRRNTYVS